MALGTSRGQSSPKQKGGLDRPVQNYPQTRPGLSMVRQSVCSLGKTVENTGHPTQAIIVRDAPSHAAITTPADSPSVTALTRLNRSVISMFNGALLKDPTADLQTPFQRYCCRDQTVLGYGEE
ncbi:hypothetical protein RUND412_007138 [Rhizina undulata]